MANAARQWRVKYDGPCSACGRVLLKGTPAVWDRAARKMSCLDCAGRLTLEEGPPIDYGVAGGSAREEHERRASRRAADVRARWGDRIGGWILRLSEEPQSTRAWRIGAEGEERLAEALQQVDGLRVLNDRRVPGTKGNIDHVVIGPAGVFVVDAKNYRGRIEIRDRGGFFRTDLRLYIGSRDKSQLAYDLEWQVEAVRRVLAGSGFEDVPPVTPVLCFIDGDWPLFRAPVEFAGVRLEGVKSLQQLVTRPVRLDADQIEAIAAAIAAALPPKRIPSS